MHPVDSALNRPVPKLVAPGEEPKKKTRVVPVHRFKPGTRLVFSNDVACIIQSNGSMKREDTDRPRGKAAIKAAKKAKRKKK